MIHYECDNCGSMVTTSEALGTGVYQDDSRGKVYMYEDMTTRVTVVVNLADEDHPARNQFCYACMWAHLKRMIELMGPPDDTDTSDGETADPGVQEVSTPPSLPEASPIVGPFSPLRHTFRPHPFPYDSER